MSKKLKVGIIGINAIGAIHAEAYQQTAQAELAAICDIDAALLAGRAERFGVKNSFTDYRDLLKSDVEAVSVCVPNSLHLEIAVAALRAGKHVLLEKPMAMNAAEARKIAAAGKKARGVLQIGMVRRQFPEAKVLREYAAAGELGKIHHMRAVWIRRRGIPGLGGWFTSKAAAGGGPMIDLGVHLFDVAMWLGGHWNPTRVSARNYAKFGPDMRSYKYVEMWAGPPRYDGVFDVEDYTTGFVRFGDKATLAFDISWAANGPEEDYVEILGDKGGARIFDGKPVQIYTEHNGRLVNIAPQFDANVNPFAVQAEKFIAACRGKGKPVATAEEGVTVMRLIDAIYASSSANKEVAIRL